MIRASKTGTVPMAARRVAGRRTTMRFQSTTAGTGPSSSASTSHLAAGVAGGAVVLGGGYVFYHFSGAKKAVDVSRTAQQYYAQAKQTVVEKAPKNPNEVLNFLRSTVKSYAGFIPGGSSYVDSTFDTLDQLHESHREEVDKILQSAYDEINGILKEKKEGLDVDTAWKILDVVKRRTGELEEVGKQAGKDLFQNVAEKYPQVSEKLGGGYQELKDMAQKRGPEARKILDDATNQVQKIFEKGFSADALNQARELIQSKTDEVRKLAEKSSQDAWKRTLQEAGPYLDKLPDIKQVVEENAQKFIAAGTVSLSGSSSTVQEVFARVKEVAESGDDKKKQELKDFISKKASDAEQQSKGTAQKGWQALEQWIKAIPGGEEALQKVPDAKVVLQLSQERSEDAQKLTKETYEDILKVLQEKGAKAKKLVNKTKDEAKEKPSS